MLPCMHEHDAKLSLNRGRSFTIMYKHDAYLPLNRGCHFIIM